MKKRKYFVLPISKMSKAKGRAANSCDDHCICYYETVDKTPTVARHTVVVAAIETSCE
jgi:hypothetical protein